MAKLTNKKHERFALEYLKDLNAAQAAVRAGYSAKSAETNGPRLLRNAQVAARVQELADKRAERQEISLGRVLDELARVAFFDLREAVLWGPRGVTLRDCEELCPEHAAAIESVSQTDKGLKIKAHNKIEALRELRKHLDPLAREQDQPGTGTLRVIVEVQGAKDAAQGGVTVEVQKPEEGPR